MQAPDDVVLVFAGRTPMCKAKRGGLRDTPVDDMVAACLTAATETTRVRPEEVGDVIMGSVLGSGSQRATECRVGMFLAGFPEKVPVHTVNRQCSSGLQAIAHAAANIKAGYYNIAIAGGVESMTTNPMTWEGGANPRIEENDMAAACLIPMGITSENVAARFNVTREEQDAAAERSHARASAAQKAGKFKDEIIPITVKQVDKKSGEEKVVTLRDDDGIRHGISVEKLGKLPAAFAPGGSTTAGNSSQVTDGCSVCMLMSRSEAQRRGLPVLGTFRSFSVVGLDPAIMGIGPQFAIPEAVKMAGLDLKDIDLFEINEAFASQFTHCAKALNLDMDRVNVNGGAIALGHPLGCTGSRCTATLLHEMGRRGDRYGVVSMCIGSGMGAAAVFERN